MAYTNGTGLSYFTVGPPDTDPVSDGASYLRDIIAWMKDPTAGPGSLNELPIGSIYMNETVDTNPGDAALLGYGTWVELEARVLLGAGEDGGSTFVRGATAGAESINLEHNHQWHSTSGGSGSGSYGIDCITGGASVKSSFDSGGAAQDVNATENELNKNHYTNKQLSASQSIMPPYRVVKMWKRTA